MTWNNTWPNGTVSVRANQAPGLQNTQYTSSTMGSAAVGVNLNTTTDHFWNQGAGLSGHHRFLKMPAFVDNGGLATDPIYDNTYIQGVMYCRTVSADVARVEGFYKNDSGIYQFIPSFVSGTATITTSFSTLVVIPANVYGEIFLFRSDAGSTKGQAGFFKSNATVCDAWSYGQRLEGGTTAVYPIRLGNGADANGLNLRVRLDEAVNTTNWNYRITYRAI